ncbi:unnamed protein product [Arctia plantaginis]|uniref:BPTI/Kunitz inhibitor domain-containing protein n=1 Tax=Arctia plantaginis TaxID=874455 RepID=A0A8S0Z681_ARCPL|nr:unnamed protein product [Arctia plantaginis]
MQPNGYDCSQWQNGSSIPRYYYDLKMRTCATFDYFECKVSLNNFISLFECNEHCRVAGYQRINVTKPSVYCRLQPDFGDCHNYHPMFYYDITTRSCKGFSYGGCGGNRNKFENAQKCVAVCSGIVNLMN